MICFLAVARTDHFSESPLDVFKQLLLRALVASNFGFDVLTSIGVVVCVVVCFGVWPLVGRWFVLVGFWFGLGFLSCVHAIIMFSLLHNGQNCCRIFGQNCCRIFGRYGRCRCFEVHVDGLTGWLSETGKKAELSCSQVVELTLPRCFCWGLVRERWKLLG